MTEPDDIIEPGLDVGQTMAFLLHVRGLPVKRLDIGYNIGTAPYAVHGWLAALLRVCGYGMTTYQNSIVRPVLGGEQLGKVVDAAAKHREAIMAAHRMGGRNAVRALANELRLL